MAQKDNPVGAGLTLGLGLGFYSALPLLFGWTVAYFVVLDSAAPFWQVYLGLVGAVVALGMLLGASSAFRAGRSARRHERERKEQARRDELARAYDGASRAAADAIDTIESLQGWLATARGHAADAGAHFRNGAYSPFWSAIEGAYAALGGYHRAIQALQALPGAYAGHAGEYRRGGGETPLPPFPSSVDTAVLGAAAGTLLRRLGSLVYEAQRDPVFAQIWEQRRTTAAVVAGFASLEHAVGRMGGAIAASVHDLAGTLEHAESAVSAAVGEVNASTRAVAATVTSASAESLRLQRVLNERIAAVERQLTA
ncbi:hypothetical protein [Sediminivirga luteola]|uniref:Uncharacterized protein n=1 Tax=Sediminivirga luteola TaxID=1774748 RepID=A0A8J2TYJ2_9MICO|nr:hypothetical protein [Sediminivirga luteola]GGA17094.1 hypothetical protein GCM10011333_20220 [Sediminivirga luteola]